MSIATSAIHRMGKVLGSRALEGAPIAGPRIGRYALKKRLGRLTWVAKDTKRDQVCLVQILGRKSLAPKLAQRNQEIGKLKNPVLLPWFKITLCGDLAVGARRYLSCGKQHEHMQSAFQLAQAVLHLHEHDIPHGAIDDDHVLFDRSGTPVLAGFELDGTLQQDIAQLQAILDKWVGMNEKKYASAQEIVDELHERLLASRKNPRIS